LYLISVVPNQNIPYVLYTPNETNIKTKIRKLYRMNTSFH